MPVQPTYPGVYIEEIPSGVRTITGVATSITAFVGYTRKGEPNKAVQISSLAEFERLYGGLDRESPVSYAVQQFYINGGGEAIIVRVATGFQTAAWTFNDATAVALEVRAASPGGWGTLVSITIDHADVRNPDGDFNLTVLQRSEQGAQARKVEVHRNLTLNSKSSNFVESVVNNASAFIRVSRKAGLAFSEKGFASSKPFDAAAVASAIDFVLAGVLDGATPFKVVLNAAPADIDQLVADVNAALTTQGLNTRLVASKSGAGSDELKLESQTMDESSSVSVSAGTFNGLAAKLGLGLTNGGKETPGAAKHRPVDVADVLPSTKGSDGGKASPAELLGTPSAKTGIYALLDVDLFNILVVPETFDMQDLEAGAVISAAVALCEQRRAFCIVDPPSTKSLSNIGTWANGVLHSRNAAVYFPSIRIADPLDQFRPRTVAASGSIAGVYARTDAERGVWKAPAGIDAVLKGVDSLPVLLNDAENGRINPVGVNALRVFRDYGKVVWGARTTKGSDAQADEYKYVPVRRLALFLEESLYRGTHWVVFEPNDEPLWAQIRLNIGAFLNNLFRKGAFQGTTPREAYFVKCDKTTTTQNDINLGIVNIVVGFAPLKPAEFVILQIQQMAGQIET